MKQVSRAFSLNLSFCAFLFPAVLVSVAFETVFVNQILLKTSMLIISAVYLIIFILKKPCILFDKLHQFGVVPNAARPAIFGSSMFFMAMSIYTPGIDNNKSIINLLIILFGISYIWAAFVNTYWEIEIE